MSTVEGSTSAATPEASPPRERTEVRRPSRAWRLLTRDIEAFDRERLEAAIQAVATEREAREKEHAPVRADGRRWAERSAEHLQTARSFLAGGKLDAAWSALHAADQALVESYGRTELRVEADRVVREGAEKLHGWRRESVVEDALSSDWGRLDDAARLRSRIEAALEAPAGDDGGDGASTLRARVRAALADVPPRDEEEALGELRTRVREGRQVLDTNQENVHRKLRILRGHLYRGGVVLLLVLTFTFAVLVFAGRAGWAPDQAFSIAEWWSFLVVASFGALAAAASGTLALLVSDREQRIPDVKAQRALVFLRPPIGAAAAVIGVGILRSGLGGLQLDPEPALAVAFVAGFSERFVSRAVAAASAAIEK